MCFKYATPKLKDLLKHLETQPPYTVEEYHEYYFSDGFKHQNMPVTTTQSKNTIDNAAWGLIPSWIRDIEQAEEWANKTLNARSETIFEKASYKQYIGNQRCLVWASGFFEHKWEDADGKNKTPYFIYMENKQPFTMGGVYSIWVEPETGEIVKTFSIITTDANTLMSEIHNSKKRMPLIITQDKRDKWLAELKKEELQKMMQPLSDGLLAAHSISNLINKKTVNRNVPEIQEAYTYPKNTLF